MKTISDQIAKLETENEKLKEISRAYDKSLKILVGADLKTIRKALEKSNDPHRDFVKKISQFYSLKSDKDFEDYLAVFLSENSLNFFKNKRPGNSSSAAERDR